MTGNLGNNGGGIYHAGLDLTLLNCTVSGNTATTYGNLCDHAGATVTGQISFTGIGACPP